jgi:hypothetical protein
VANNAPASKRLGEVQEFKVTDPAHPVINLGNRVAVDVPVETLPSRRKCRTAI